MNNFIERKWSSGEKYKKTHRLNKVKDALSREELNNFAISAQKQSLLSENDIWSISSIPNDMNFKINNKKDDTSQKINEREMIGQIGMNPFMENNYLNDISVQDMYLKPLNTTLENESK